MLVVADAGAITDREADSLYNVVSAAHLPVVILQVVRRLSESELPSGKPTARNDGSTYFQQSQLTSLEADRFVHFLARERPAAEVALRQLLRPQARRIREWQG